MHENYDIRTGLLLEALHKAKAYCAYQERCHAEVREKLFRLELNSLEVENIISELIAGDFLNEERFAKVFSGGKFRIKKWGKIKIKNELKARQISDYCIKAGLKEINENEYQITLQEIIQKKSKELKEKESYKKQTKIARFAISKGFEPDLVWNILKN